MGVYEWDERKRAFNLMRHGLDFAEAHLVYDNPQKVTLDVQRKGEDRLQDTALMGVSGLVLTLVYVLRGTRVRCISFRVASRKERKTYAEKKRRTN